jgi:phosphoenolpyruvate carboxylase
MVKVWQFFDDLLAKIEMVCAKADMTVARAYVTTLGGDETLFEKLRAEYELTVQTLLRIRGIEHLLDDSVVLQSAIALRNPYVDALSLLQLSLLDRKRSSASSDESDAEQVNDALSTTLSGIAQGLRNTG